MTQRTQTHTDANAIRKAAQLIREKNYPAARDIYTIFCKKYKHNSDAWLMLGTLHGWLKSYVEASYCFQNSIAITPHNGQAHYNLGYALYMQGNSNAAINSFKKAIEINPATIEAQYYLGLALQDTGNLDEAENIFRILIQNRPDTPELHGVYANILFSKNQHTDALKSCNKALCLNPKYSEGYCQKARILIALNKTDDAISAYATSIQLDPNMIVAYKELGGLHLKLGNYIEAAANLEKAVIVNELDFDSWLRLGDIYLIAAQRSDAIRCYKVVIELQPDHAGAHFGLAQCYEAMSMIDLATKYYNDTLKIDSCYEMATTGLARLFLIKGEYNKAQDLVTPIIEKGAQHAGTLRVYSEVCMHNGKYDSAIAVLTNFLGQQTAEVPNLHLLHYQLGKLLDKKGQYDEAFHHFTEANERSVQDSSVERQLCFLDAMMDVFSKKNMLAIPRTEITSDVPIFIVGMPRSGTTLVEQILDTHPSVFGAGERTDIADAFRKLAPKNMGSPTYLAQNIINIFNKDELNNLAEQYLSELSTISDGALHITNKLPGNFAYIGFIELLFPKAKIIHCKRNPIDTCISIYFNDMDTSHTYATNLINIGIYYLKYLDIMKHWKRVCSLPILDIEYEDLVHNQELASRKIVEFCGLEWDSKCLEFYKNQRAVNTHSHSQVRQPIYNKSIGRQQHYKKHIRGLLDALE